jgi:hypothetical protein
VYAKATWLPQLNKLIFMLIQNFAVISIQVQALCNSSSSNNNNNLLLNF